MKFSLRSGQRPSQPAATADAAADPGTASALAAFFAVVGRVEALVDAETDAFSRNLKVDMTALNHRKRQSLLELSRVMRSAATIAGRAPVRERLQGLAAKLEKNRVVLDRQLRAMREVTEIVARSLREAESDGTYSRPARIP